MTKSLNIPGNANKVEQYRSVYATAFKQSAVSPGYKTPGSMRSEKTERPSTASHPNTRTNFQVGYTRQTGIVSTQMQSNKQTIEGHDPQVKAETHRLSEQYK